MRRFAATSFADAAELVLLILLAALPLVPIRKYVNTDLDSYFPRGRVKIAPSKLNQHFAER